MSSITTRRVLSLISPMSVAGYKKTRLGKSGDGGYVLIDNLVDSSCCVSVGVGGDVSFDAALADRGYDIFQYDHTVDGTPITHEKFRFQKIGLAPRHAASDHLHDLDRIISEHHITNYVRPILKIDIEDAEWDVLAHVQSSTLKNFDQICLEFHNMNRLNDNKESRKIEETFRLLYQTHAPVHIHGNNWGKFCIINGIPVPDVIEMTYVSRESYTILPSSELFPTALDTPNKSDVPDFFLGEFRF
jgi:hypothetical protein